MWGLILREPMPGTYTIEPAVQWRQSRRWHIVEFKGLINFEIGADERAMHSAVLAMEHAGRCRFFHQDSDF